MHLVQGIQFLVREWQIVGETSILIVRKWINLID